MHISESGFSFSPTDLSNFHNCRHLIGLEIANARGTRKRPYFADPLSDALRERGLRHEADYVATLTATGATCVDLRDVKDRTTAARQTLDAMRSGIDVIVQGALLHDRWYGRPDVLKRVATASALGDWSYEVVDTKLARETRAGSILQLVLYCELLAVAQGHRPESFKIITTDKVAPNQSYRLGDYSAYVRLVRSLFEEMVELPEETILANNYPDPVNHCEVCAWSGECRSKRRSDDHLSLVAGLTRLHQVELEARDTITLSQVAELPLPIEFKPKRGSRQTFTRIREQARLQHQSRDIPVPLHELREIEAGTGLCRLPEPSRGDLFLDLEGDPFVGTGGREYLVGVVGGAKRIVIPAKAGTQGPPTTTLGSRLRGNDEAYQAFWAFDEREERAAFERTMDLIMNAWAADEGMHIYHYNHYEPSAFKRLMGKYATREQELDRLLRAERFVDLYAVVRQSMLAGIERYSIKNLEPLYGFRREIDLAVARKNLRLIEVAVEYAEETLAPAEVRAAVQGYNKDDCVSTFALRDWLEVVRQKAITSGAEIPRPVVKADAPSERITEHDAQVADLRRRLLEARHPGEGRDPFSVLNMDPGLRRDDNTQPLRSVPEDAADRSAEESARWLLAYLLDYHRRESKSTWWEYYNLRGLSDEELLDEAKAIAGLEFLERIDVGGVTQDGRPKGAVVDRYKYSPQSVEVSPGDKLNCRDTDGIGDVSALDRNSGTVDIRKPRKKADLHPTAVFAFDFVGTDAIDDALLRFGERAAQAGSLTALGACAESELLLRHAPRTTANAFSALPREDVLAFATNVCAALDNGVLAIQGPPGSGKTHTGAVMILELARQGKKIGVTGNSHKVIRNLLDKVAELMTQAGVHVGIAQKTNVTPAKAGAHINDAKWIPASAGMTEAAEENPGAVQEVTENKDALALLVKGEVQLLGGTPWMWASADFAKTVDVLFVDEAGQMSLANAVAVSQAATNVVLLGDPQQLEQPIKGTHPDGVGVSALQHILGSAQTIAPDSGIFLPVTWRLAPAVCAFTSEAFYEKRLEPKAGLERQTLTNTRGMDGSGLWIAQVKHEGNKNSSDEEVAVVAELIDRLLVAGASWTDAQGRSLPMAASDILVVSPYNAQVNRLAEGLSGRGVRVGTVDKFQGQEAPVSIYSMATSHPDDAPRGMEFLYSLNRLNVATSRAQCATIVVASPNLFEPHCGNARQMKLANALCRFREMARNAG